MENYIQWNVVNWITVVLMVAVGWLIVGAGASLVRQGLPNAGQ
jgi:hypothetical protein